MAKRDRLSGNEAVSIAMRQIGPDVVPVYPITPSTEIPQYFSSFVANGSVTTEFIPVESEHSAMSAAIGASSAGARVMSATSSQGLCLMYEMLAIASGMRLPIVLTCVNRAISAPINIHNDHSDSMGVRDCGFIQLYGENNQEAYDNAIMAVKIAEKAMLPIMNCYDGFITSHSVENIELIDDDKVKNFVGTYSPEHFLLNDKEKVSMGPLALQNCYFEQRKELADAMKAVKNIAIDVAKDFEKISGRKYDLFEKYCLDDADVAIVVLNSTAGTAKTVVDKLRDEGIKVGLLKPRLFRPFPFEEIAEALSHLKAIAVMDKADSLNGMCGPLYSDVVTALAKESVHIPAKNYIYGLGGKDVTPTDIETVFNDLLYSVKTGEGLTDTSYLGLKD